MTSDSPVSVLIVLSETATYSTIVRMARSRFEGLDAGLHSKDWRERSRAEADAADYINRSGDWDDNLNPIVEEFRIVDEGPGHG